MPRGRPKKLNDDAVLAAAMRAMARRGPAELTLADIAEEAGLTAGALVQRFGSKRALLLRLMEDYSGSSAAMFAALRADAASPLEAIRAYGRCMAQMAASPEALARSIAWLHQDLVDPEFRVHLLAQARGVRKELARLVTEAIESGELPAHVEARALAAAIESMVSGALFGWAVHQEGKAETFMARQLDALIAPLTDARGAVKARRR
jgi:AcrR family transcriptional regulator